MDSNETSNSGKNLSWKQGKQLGEVEFTVDGNVTKAYRYYYDESGRIKKIDQGSGNYIKYHYDSDNLEYEEHYVNYRLSYLIKYFYDDQDRVQFALYKNQNFSTSYGYYNLYTYVYNGIGEITDVVKVRDGLSSSTPSISNLPVAHYEYDPYGNIVSINTYNDDTFGNINPIRYKAYYYDTDLGWYNLGSRYYDPSVGRFINCDSIGIINNNASDIENKNLYAYCNNNPVMYYDDGDNPITVAAFIIGGVASVAIDMATAAIDNEPYTISEGVQSFLVGGISTAFPGAGAMVASVIDVGINVLIRDKPVVDSVIKSGIGIGSAGRSAALFKNVMSKSTLDKAVNYGAQSFLEFSYNICGTSAYTYVKGIIPQKNVGYKNKKKSKKYTGSTFRINKKLKPFRKASRKRRSVGKLK